MATWDVSLTDSEEDVKSLSQLRWNASKFETASETSTWSAQTESESGLDGVPAIIVKTRKAAEQKKRGKGKGKGKRAESNASSQPQKRSPAAKWLEPSDVDMDATPWKVRLDSPASSSGAGVVLQPGPRRVQLSPAEEAERASPANMCSVPISRRSMWSRSARS